MNPRDAYWLWYDFKDIAGSSVARQKNVDGDQFGTDWDRQQQAMLSASLSFACSMFEILGKKTVTQHNRVLVHLRNALLHNGGDISKNNGAPNPEDDCLAYLAEQPWTEFDPKDAYGDPVKDDQGRVVKVQRRFFTIDDDHIVRLESPILFFIDRLLDSYLTQEQRELGPPDN